MSTVSGRNDSKLNSLLKNMVPHTVVTQKCLEKLGVYRQLADRYVASGWLERLGRGAYVRAGDTAQLPGGLYGLQVCDDRPVYVGGVTALGLLGYGHQIMHARETVWLYGPARSSLPAWFTEYDWGVSIRYVPSAIFEEHGLGVQEHAVDGLRVKVSAPERAALELMHEVPSDVSVSDAMALMTGLTTLRPSMVKDILQSCRSIKAKRLFLLMAEASNHRWLTKVDLGDVDLGSGKRVLGAGGVYYSKYQISLPEPLSINEDAL